MNKTILHCSYHNLKSIPTTLIDYKELEEVYLKENFIVSIPQWFVNLRNLRFIHLLGNSIEEIPENIYNLENLEFLDLSNNRLRSLPESIGNLVNLKRFSVAGNEIRVLPKGIGNLRNLEILDLNANLIRYLPREITRLSKLNEIILSDNIYLKSIPSAVFLLPNLESISADRCRLLYLPAALSASVTYVRLFNNRFISHIPIAYLRHIQKYYDIIQHINENSSHCDSTSHFLIREEETFRILIFPVNIRRCHGTTFRKPEALEELCLRRLGTQFNIPLEANINIPENLKTTINDGPTAICSNENCRVALYSECYLLLVKRLQSISKIIFSCTYCSLDCLENWKRLNKNDYYSIDWTLI